MMSNKNIPASLMKQLPGMKTYLSLEDIGICQIGKKISSTVTSHYYKGLSNHLDNLVIVMTTENREQRTENREQRTENREQRTEKL